MKISQRLSIGAAVVIVLFVAGWLLRNAIVRQVSNPILAEYDVELIDISLDALATSTASISYLKLVHARGTTIEIEDLTLPINTADSTIRTYSARRVSIETTTPDDEAPLELALLIKQFLSLPEQLAGNAINIAELEIAPYPGISDLKWAVSETEQHLSWALGSVYFSAETIRSGDTDYEIGITLAEQAGLNETQAIGGELRQNEQGILIVGHTKFGLPYLQKMGGMAGILPDAVDLKSGTGELTFEVNVPFDVAQLPAVVATVTPSSPWRVGYTDESGDSTDVLISGGSPIGIRSGLSGTEWSVQRTDMALLVTNEEWRNVPLSTTNLSCQSGPVCSLQADVVWLDAITPAGSAEKIEVSSALGVTFANNGWQLSSDAIDVGVESLSLGTDVSMTSLFYFENVRAGEIDSIVSASGGVFTPTIQLQTDAQVVTVPGMKGKISMQNAKVTFDLVTINLLRNGSVGGQHDLDGGEGDIALEGIELSFDDAPLSARVASEEERFDISSGTAALDLRANWVSAASGFLIEGQSGIQANALAGFYTDTAFVGAATNIELNYDATALTVEPTSISVELLDMGVAIENISADIEVDIIASSVDVDNLQMSAFNGVISAAPFSFSTASEVNNVILTAREIELAELLSIKEFAAVNVTGTITAVLPVAITDDGITIDAGKLDGEEPGGIIRYLGGSNLDDGEMSGLGLATAALSNFEYDSLTADVNYNRAGDLNLQMQIKGRNPELDNGRPVVLNLGVENNIPQMLKSLQAARAVEEILEKRLAD